MVQHKTIIKTVTWAGQQGCHQQHWWQLPCLSLTKRLEKQTPLFVMHCSQHVRYTVISGVG